MMDKKWIELIKGSKKHVMNRDFEVSLDQALVCEMQKQAQEPVRRRGRFRFLVLSGPIVAAITIYILIPFFQPSYLTHVRKAESALSQVQSIYGIDAKEITLIPSVMADSKEERTEHLVQIVINETELAQESIKELSGKNRIEKAIRVLSELHEKEILTFGAVLKKEDSKEVIILVSDAIREIEKSRASLTVLEQEIEGVRPESPQVPGSPYKDDKEANDSESKALIKGGEDNPSENVQNISDEGRIQSDDSADGLKKKIEALKQDEIEVPNEAKKLESAEKNLKKAQEAQLQGNEGKAKGQTQAAQAKLNNIEKQSKKKKR